MREHPNLPLIPLWIKLLKLPRAIPNADILALAAGALIDPTLVRRRGKAHVSSEAVRR